MTATAVESSSKGSKASAEEAAGRDSRQMMVVDLGKASRRRVKQLRKGGGKLMRAVEDAIAELRRSTDLPEHSQPLVVVVERKRRRRRFPW